MRKRGGDGGGYLEADFLANCLTSESGFGQFAGLIA
jgi:hypothetical protein